MENAFNVDRIRQQRTERTTAEPETPSSVAYELPKPLRGIVRIRTKICQVGLSQTSRCFSDPSCLASELPQEQLSFLLDKWPQKHQSVARNLPALLELLCGLAQGSAAAYVSELLQAQLAVCRGRARWPMGWPLTHGRITRELCVSLGMTPIPADSQPICTQNGQAPLNMMRLPYRLLRHITEFEDWKNLWRVGVWEWSKRLGLGGTRQSWDMFDRADSHQFM